VKEPGDVPYLDVGAELDRELTHDLRITLRVFHALLLHKHEGLFPQRKEPILSPTDSPR